MSDLAGWGCRRGTDMTVSDTALNGGLDLEATCERVFGALNKMHEGAECSAWLEEHWAATGNSSQWGELSQSDRVTAARGSKEFALALVAERLYEFCERERPVAAKSRAVREARRHLEGLVEALRTIDPFFAAGLASYGLTYIDQWLGAHAWEGERYPLAVRELEGARGRPRGDFRAELVTILANGGYAVAEIVDLIIDPLGRDGAAARLHQVLHQQRTVSL
jgi:hypothetical protein